MSRPPGHRERKKERTRRTIALAARELFLSKGFDETTVDEVAESAGVSRRTVFRYFPTKESMVFPHRGERLWVGLLQEPGDLVIAERRVIVEIKEMGRHGAR